ncbi:MAG: 4'-phosphopantetheinyl transferase superfamily protein [Bacilli bacterium]|nr:4'-phosphopantetheinyl transferase superfamily protein [Bacilli bacterium]
MAVVYILNANNLKTDLTLYKNIDKRRLEKIKKSKNTLFIKEQLGSHLLLTDVLENTYFQEIDKIEYIYNESGKPYIKDSSLYFSLSHSNGIIALTVSKEEIGLDIELIKDVKDTLSRRIMNDLEYNTYQSLNKESKKIYFFEVWTSKEAYIKKLGTSITLNPSNISIEDDVLLKKINISSNEYMIALTNALSITIDERYIPKELLERNK